MIPVSCFLYYNIRLQERAGGAAAARTCNTKRGVVVNAPAKVPLCIKWARRVLCPFSAKRPFGSKVQREESRVFPDYKPLQFLAGETVKICNLVCLLTPLR